MEKYKRLSFWFGKRLENLCQIFDVSVNELAEGIGVNKRTVKAWFMGKAMPLVNQIESICHFLQIPCDIFFNFDDISQIDEEGNIRPKN